MQRFPGKLGAYVGSGNMIEESEVLEAEAVIEEVELPEVPTPDAEEVQVKNRRGRAADKPEPAEVVAEEVSEVVPPKPMLFMHALVYSPTRKNSESVALLQRRLSDVGYADARADLRGWFHDSTREALVKWQTDHKLEVTGECAFDDMRYLFDGTDVEIVVPVE